MIPIVCYIVLYDVLQLSIVMFFCFVLFFSGFETKDFEGVVRRDILFLVRGEPDTQAALNL